MLDLPHKAIELIMTYGKKQGIKTLDSFQIACALKAEDFTFVTSDKNLTNILEQLNIDIANPED